MTKEATIRAHTKRIRLIAKDGTVVVVEPQQTVVLDMTKAPWTYVPETGEPS